MTIEERLAAAEAEQAEHLHQRRDQMYAEWIASGREFEWCEATLQQQERLDAEFLRQFVADYRDVLIAEYAPHGGLTDDGD